MQRLSLTINIHQSENLFGTSLVNNFIISLLIAFFTYTKLFDMALRIRKFRRIWRTSPRLALVFLRRQMFRQAKRIVAIGEWNINWLGEEMRPFNSHG